MIMIPVTQRYPGCFETSNKKIFINNGIFQLNEKQHYLQDIDKVSFTTIALSLYILENQDMFFNKEILELNVGVGMLSKYLYKFAKSITFLDDISQLYKYDVIIASDWIYNDVLKEYLKPGGKIIIFNSTCDCDMEKKHLIIDNSYYMNFYQLIK